MTRAACRRGWRAAGFAFIALVAWLSLTPQPVDAGRLGEVKIGHFVAYGWLMLWFSQLHASALARIAMAAGFIVLGVALEYAQSLTGYRSFAYADMRDNALGVFMGAALAFTPLGRVLSTLEARLAPPGTR